MSEDDQDLRQVFAAMREEERARTPLWRVSSPPPARSGMTRVAGWAAVAAAVLVAFLVSRPRPPQPTIVEWRSPTDFLLQTPGRELLAGYPVLGQGYVLSEKGARP